MALSTQPYKGARDFYPEDKRIQKYMFATLRKTVEKYGYEEYDAPVLEPLELYLAKTGEEIINEQTYAFTDRGGRQVAIRPEMTPTVSRMVAARRQELAYPLRWYSIPNLWRYERPQRGRLREHWQLNVDVFGIEGIYAELEIIQVSDQIFKAFGARPDMYEIRLNSRQFMDYVLNQYMRLDEVASHGVAKLIDRMHKLSSEDFLSQLDSLLSPEQRAGGGAERLLAVLQSTTFDALPAEAQAQPSLIKLRETLAQLIAQGISNVRFDVTLMRGFDYYSDIVFEVFDTDPDNNRSMMGGGRYDGLVGLFGVEPVPTVGFGLGDATLLNFLEIHGLLPSLPVETEAYIVLVGDVIDAAERPIAELREMGITVAVDYSGRKIGDQLKNATKKDITFAIIIGENELSEEVYSLKNLVTGSEEKHSLQRIVSIVKDRRTHS